MLASPTALKDYLFADSEAEYLMRHNAASDISRRELSAPAGARYLRKPDDDESRSHGAVGPRAFVMPLDVDQMNLGPRFSARTRFKLPHTRSNGVAWSRLRSTTIRAARGWLYAENRRTRCPLTSLASSVRNDSRVCCPSMVSARPSNDKRRLTTRETFLRTSCGNVSLTPDCRLIRLKP